MKKLTVALLLVATLIWAATPNVPLYVNWDGYIAAPTQFLQRVFVAGSNVVFQDNRTNLVIHSSAVGAYAIADIITSNGVVNYANGVTNNSLVRTNSSITIATNATEFTADFSRDVWYEVPTLMVGAITVAPTNLIFGREVWIHFRAANGNYTVAVSNAAGTSIHWAWSSATNGNTDITVTNNTGAELSLKCWSNNVVNAVYGTIR